MFALCINISTFATRNEREAGCYLKKERPLKISKNKFWKFGKGFYLCTPNRNERGIIEKAA